VENIDHAARWRVGALAESTTSLSCTFFSYPFDLLRDFIFAFIIHALLFSMSYFYDGNFILERPRPQLAEQLYS